MNRLKALLKLNPRLLLRRVPNARYIKPFTFLCVLLSLSAVIWFYGPLLTWGDYALLAQPEKRIYIIACLLLIWVLEFFIVDLDIPKPLHFKNSVIQKRMLACQHRFRGAVEFLRKTTISKQGKSVHLSQLPWFLLIGPPHAGKTSLLAHSNIPFILQRQFAAKHHSIQSTQHCDWWVTRDSTIIDVAGRYLLPVDAATKSNPAAGKQPVLWQFLLKLIRKYRGKHGIDGIILLLPLPDLLENDNDESLNKLTGLLSKRLSELKTLFPKPIPVYYLISKCDQLSGFKEYFTELGNDEAAMAWGINLTDTKEKYFETLNQRFNALIKKLNEQLLARLHHERSAAARPHIKDFPLEVEKLKLLIFKFTKKFAAACPGFNLQGIYLTSAHQHPAGAAEKGLSTLNQDANPVQLLHSPQLLSRSYFIRQFLAQGLTFKTTYYRSGAWKRYAAYAVCTLVVILTSTLLGRDFSKGVKNVYALQKQITDYRIEHFQNQEEQLEKTLLLLNKLYQSAEAASFKLDLKHLLSFYSYKSQATAGQIYRQAVQTILMPQIRNYFEDYLRVPVNSSVDEVYSVLKAYLMLGDSRHFDPIFIINEMQKLIPKSITENEAAQLVTHLQLALRSQYTPLPLNSEIVNNTRHYLSATPSIQLSFTILKNMNDDRQKTFLSLSDAKLAGVFVCKDNHDQIPAMFTIKNFQSVFSQKLSIAAKETVEGNWVLGRFAIDQNSRKKMTDLTERLRAAYIKDYAQTWEKVLSEMRIANTSSLVQTDNVISQLISKTSPLLQLLKTVKSNTFFQPIAGASPKLKLLSTLLDKNKQSEQQLYQIFAGLQTLHQYLQPIVVSKTPRKTAFEMLSRRMTQTTPDPIIQLRLIADKSPEPIKNWLHEIADNAWRSLSQEAGKYLNTAWEKKVLQTYQHEIAQRYPFSNSQSKDVELESFVKFFGSPGILLSFYKDYLANFIDESKSNWKWKTSGSNALPFSKDALRQIQHAIHIHRAFFPNGDNKLFVQFALEPYQFGKKLKRLQLSISDQKFIDIKPDKISHTFTWPGKNQIKKTSLKITLADEKAANYQFPGDWGWFRLVNQSFESAISKKQLLINLSRTEVPAKYYLFTKNSTNPFVSLDLTHFQLPLQLAEQST